MIISRVIVRASCVVSAEPCNDTTSADLTLPVTVALLILAATLIAIVVGVCGARRRRRER